MKVTLTSYTPEPEKAIVEAAATCWKSTPREEILDHIIKAGHHTPLEFAVFNFRIEGVSRALTHQLVRKRVGVAFAQESQRYVKYDNEVNYILPDSIRKAGAHVVNRYKEVMHATFFLYRTLLDNDIPPEDARFILPNSCTSTISMSINYHALLDLFKERDCRKAQWEIRELVGELKKAVSEISPKLADYLQPKCWWLKHCPEAKPCGRHKPDRCRDCRNIYCQTNPEYAVECRTNFFSYYLPKEDLR